MTYNDEQQLFEKIINDKNRDEESRFSDGRKLQKYIFEDDRVRHDYLHQFGIDEQLKKIQRFFK